MKKRKKRTSGSPAHTNYAETSSMAKELSLAEVNKEIEAALQKRATEHVEPSQPVAPVVKVAPKPVAPIVRTAPPKTVSPAAPVQPFVIVGKPEDNIEYMPVNRPLIYAIALLAGLLIPLAGLVIKKLNMRAFSWFGLVKLTEKIQSLFVVRQID